MEFFTNPIFGLLVGIIVGAVALTGRLSVIAARALLTLAWIIGCASLAPMSLSVLWIPLYTVAIGGIFLWARPEVVPKDFGEIIPGRFLLLNEGMKGNLPLQIEIGNSGTIFLNLSDKPVATLFSFFNRSKLTIETIRGRLAVSTAVTDQSGNVIAEIIRNKWKVGRPHAWDRNYSRDAFEVKNAAGKIVLQVHALKDRIRIQGEWWGDDLKGVRIMANPDRQERGAVFAVFGSELRPEEVEDIEPMFLYPSELNFGKLAKPH